MGVNEIEIIHTKLREYREFLKKSIRELSPHQEEEKRLRNRLRDISIEENRIKEQLKVIKQESTFNKEAMLSYARKIKAVNYLLEEGVNEGEV